MPASGRRGVDPDCVPPVCDMLVCRCLRPCADNIRWRARHLAGLIDVSSAMLAGSAPLKAIRDQSRVDANRVSTMLESAGQKPITAPMLAKFADTACQRMRLPGSGYRRDHLRALAQRVEVNDGEVRIMGSKSELLRTLAAAGGAGPMPGAVPSLIPKWRTGGIIPTELSP